MTNSELIQQYNQRIDDFTQLLAKKNSTINKVSTVRLVVALGVLVFVYFSFKSAIYLLPLGILVAVFIGFVYWHNKMFLEKTHIEHLITVNKNEVSSLNGDYSFSDKGLDYHDANHSYALDLDVFGEGSLFQYLTRACTTSGKEALAHRLCSPLTTKNEITENQVAIRELSSNLEFMQHLQATGMHTKDSKSDRLQLRTWLSHPYLFYSVGVFKQLRILLPLITAVSIVLTFFIPVVKPLALLMVLTQLGFTGFYLKRVSAFHDYVSRKKEVLEHYSNLLRVMNSEKFRSPLLINLQRISYQAAEKVTLLAKQVRALDARLNSMTSLVMNGLFLYDMQCVYRLEQWKEKNSPHLDRWLDAISTMEMLNCFGTYGYNNNSFCYASISESLSIRTENLAHPLLQSNERVVNTITLGDPHSVFVVTGANMAGKSTFLRTVGVNMVLALNGAPVCAQSFECPLLKIHTSMRTTDSLKDHQSYFYAELKRLKTIVEELKAGAPILVLFDEILKGTNSTDKLTGSIALVRQLLTHPCLAIIATHDLLLGNMAHEFPNRIKNYHFEPTIEDDQLSFDYLIKPGVAEKMNATFLMKKMGIISS